jgi:LmbE family N-acetylglucosaminyl deacetylase
VKLRSGTAKIFVPDGVAEPDATERITHLGIGAHPDDLEFMALHGILQCYDSETKWFGGITCTDGGGSLRAKKYADFTAEQMRAVRREEQNKAAVVGRYGVMIQLGYSSSVAKSCIDDSLKSDLKEIIAAARPGVIYTHNPADKHETHIGVMIATLQALRELPRDERPASVYGCEVWRGLDWMVDNDKVAHDVSAGEKLAETLSEVFDSQIGSGKRYDLATIGRRKANATFFDPNAADESAQLAFAMDLSPLVEDVTLDLIEFTCGHIAKFENDVRKRLSARLGR